MTEPKRPAPHLVCPDCGATPGIPHEKGCPWLVFSPPGWDAELKTEVTAAQVGLKDRESAA